MLRRSVIILAVATLLGSAAIARAERSVSAAPAGANTLESLNTAGNQANGPVDTPAVDDAGDVVFSSPVALSPSDVNSKSDVYLRSGSTTTLISRTAGGAGANDDSGSPSISPAGDFIAFTSTATNLSGAAGNGKSQIYLYNVNTTAITLASPSTSGATTPADGASTNPSVTSASGVAHVAFASLADDLVSGDFSGARDIFVRSGSNTKRITVNENGAEANGPSFAPAIAIAGGVEHVAFESDADNLVVPDDSDGVRDVFRYNSTGSPALTQVSITGAATTVPDGASSQASISDDGTKVAFTSSATNLASGDTNGVADVFVHDFGAGTTTIASASSTGVQGNATSDSARISGDGALVVFRSFADGLVTSDTNQLRDIFLTRLGGHQTISLTAGANGRSNEPAIATDGSFEAFSSDATNLDGTDTNPATDVFQRKQDVLAPGAPNATVDGHHIANSPTWSNDATISFSVSATDAGSIISGVAGYSAAFSSSPTTTPARTITNPSTGVNTTITSLPLPSSAHMYFHVRAVDNAGNWGPTTTEGPYRIDVTEPTLPGVSETPDDAFDYALATTVTLKWKSTDAHSGVQGYDLFADHAAANQAAAGWSSTTNLLTDSTATTKSVSVTKGFSYRFWVRTHDQAGNTVTGPKLEVAIPVDSPVLSHSSGWTTASNTNTFGGSALRSSTFGASITYNARHIDAFAIVYTACPGCGTFDVYLNGKKEFSLNSERGTTHYKQVSAQEDAFNRDPATIKFVVTSHGKPVYIDAIAIVRH